MEHGNSSQDSSGSKRAGDLSPDHKPGSSMAMGSRLPDEGDAGKSINALSRDRKAPLGQDSTAMTIEFLRARLLSERSVSKAARQKAQQLAKKVMELERQLEIVVEERKRAEEATQEALAKLEHGGMIDYSDAFDSGTDQDGAPCESKILEGMSKGTCFGPSSAGEEEETLTMPLLGNGGSEEPMPTSKFDMDETNRFDPHHNMRRGLSWQTRGNSCVHREKNAKKSLKQALEQTYLNSLHSVGILDGEFSAQKRIGKSCRQIKRRETRPVIEEEPRVLSACSEDETGGPVDSTSEEFSHSGQKEWDLSSKVFEDKLEDDFEGSCHTGNEKAICSNSSNQAAEEGDEPDGRNDKVGGHTSGEDCMKRVRPEDRSRQIESGSDANGSDKEMEMERVLEQRAELIDQYEAEENAQREWEEKFRELNCASEQIMDCHIDERQAGETEESNELEGVYFSRSKKKVAAVLNSQRKEETERSDQSASGEFSIQNIEKSVSSEVEIINGKSLEGTANETIPEMQKNVSEGFCTMACRSPLESNTCKESPVDVEIERLVNKNDNFVKAIPIENTLEHRQRESHKKSTEQEEQGGTIWSYVLNSVDGKDCSSKQVPATTQVAKSTNNIAENVPEQYWKGVRRNLTEQSSPILEKHISDATQANIVLTPFTCGAYEKAIDTRHGVEIPNPSSTRLPAKDLMGRVPDGVQAGNEIEYIGPATQLSQLGKHWMESKTGAGGCENPSGGGLMVRADEKLCGLEALQHVSHGSVLRNSIQTTSDSVPKGVQGTLKSWSGGNNDKQGSPMMQEIDQKQLVTGITCDSMHPRISDNPLKYIPDYVPKEVQGALKIQHSDYNNEQGFPMIQGIHQKQLVAQITCDSMHPRVSDNPLKYMSSFAMEHMQMQGQKKIEESFTTTDSQSTVGTSHAILGTRSKDNLEGRSFSGQPHQGNSLSESKMVSMGELTPITATQSVRGDCCQTSWPGARSSEHSNVGSASMANHFPENSLSRPPYQDSYHHFTMNRIDTAFGSNENYVLARDSGPYPQMTVERNGRALQKEDVTLDTNHCSAKYKFPINSQEHSKSISSKQLAMPTPGNANVSGRKDFESSFKSFGDNSMRDRLHLSHINQDRLHGRVRALQPLLRHQNDRFRDALMALHLAKSQIQNTLHGTQSMNQHLNQTASFMQESHTENMTQSRNPFETPLNCAELFRLPSEADHRLPSQIQVSRPSLADCSHSVLMRIPNSLSSSVNGRDRASLHILHNENAEILARRQSVSADNHSAQVKKSNDNVQFFPRKKS